MHNDKKIICLAVDDEPPALDILEKYISSVQSLTLAATFDNAIETFNYLQNHPVDLLFLDIQMPKLLGTDLIRIVKNPPRVIFTTAYRKFAIEGFELDAVDYLLKPISIERFLKAVNKVMELAIPNPASYNELEISTKPATDPFICFRTNRKMVKVKFEEILYIESLNDYVKVVTLTKNIITKQSISSLEETLSKEGFIRIHRSFIVALNKINSYSADMVEIGKTELPVSRMYRHEFERFVMPAKFVLKDTKKLE